MLYDLRENTNLLELTQRMGVWGSLRVKGNRTEGVNLRKFHLDVLRNLNEKGLIDKLDRERTKL